MLLSDDDELHVEHDRVRLVRGGFKQDISIRGATAVESVETAPEKIGTHRLAVIHVHATGRLKYIFRFGST